MKSMGRIVTLGVLLVGVMLSTANAQIGADLLVQGEFKVACPRADFGWALVKEGRDQNSLVRIYACGKKGVQSGMLLTVDSRPANTDATRRSTVTTHYNQVIESMKEDGYTDIRARQPEVGGQIPNRVSFDLEGKDPEGKLEYLYVEIVFGRCVYTFQAVSDSDADAQKLVSAARTLRELKPVSGNAGTK